MSLRDRLNKLNADKIAEAANKPEVMTEERTNLILSNKSTSGVKQPEHDRPLSPLLKLRKKEQEEVEQVETPKAIPTVKTEKKTGDKLSALRAKLAKGKEQVEEEPKTIVLSGKTKEDVPTVPLSETSPAVKASLLSKEEEEPKLSPLERLRQRQNKATNTALAALDSKPEPQEKGPDPSLLDKKPEPKPQPKLNFKANAETKAEPKPSIFKPATVAPEEVQGALDEAIDSITEETKKGNMAALRARIKANRKPAPKLMADDQGYAELEAATSKTSAMAQAVKAKPIKQETIAPSKSSLEVTKDSFAAKLAALRKDKENKPVVHSEVKGIVDEGRAIEHKQADITMPKIEVIESHHDTAPQVQEVERADKEMPDNRKAVTLNAKQMQGVEWAREGKSFCLIGPAGTGKTTSVREILRMLRDEGKIHKSTNFKVQGAGSSSARRPDQWSVACVGFTRTAALNLRASVTSDPDLRDFYYCCQTVHNLLEYQPTNVEVWSEELGDYKESMRFLPVRDHENKLDIDVLIIEEASMLDLMLGERLMRALKPDTQIIYLGDINQLPPVFGLPMLAYALHKLPVIELTEVYRQSIGPILNNAHRILVGDMPTEEESDKGTFSLYHEYQTPQGKTSIKSHSKDAGTPISVGQEEASKLYTKVFELFHKNGTYDPTQDIILSPWNVRELGIHNLNACIAQFIGDARNAIVYEIIAGFAKHYLAVGDAVMVDKQPGVITEINGNSSYIGRQPQHCGADLTRFGGRVLGKGSDIDLDEMADDYDNFDIDAMTDQDVDEITRAASHCVTVELETGETKTISSAGDFNGDKFSLGYVLSGHKSQGMEWRNVWIICHSTQGATVNREWLYTTVTRAKKGCTIFGHAQTIKKRLASQRIVGNTLEQKIDNFTGSVSDLDEIRILPTGEIRPLPEDDYGSQQ